MPAQRILWWDRDAVLPQEALFPIRWALPILTRVRYNLLFERFLNPERVSMPDIDVDFCYERRQEVIDYVVEKYGKDQVVQIITFGTLAAKGVVLGCRPCAGSALRHV